MNKMQRISISFIDVNSVKFAYGVGIEKRLGYLRNPRSLKEGTET